MLGSYFFQLENESKYPCAAATKVSSGCCGWWLVVCVSHTNKSILVDYKQQFNRMEWRKSVKRWNDDGVNDEKKKMMVVFLFGGQEGRQATAGKVKKQTRKLASWQ